MYTQDNVPPPEYRVRTVVRYVVTRYCHPYEHTDGMIGHCGGSVSVCEVPTENGAHDIARALAHLEGGTVQQE